MKREFLSIPIIHKDSIGFYNNEEEYSEAIKPIGSTIFDARKSVCSLFIGVLSSLFELENYHDVRVLFEEGIGCVLSLNKRDCSEKLKDEIIESISKVSNVPFKGYWSKGLSTNGFVESHISDSLDSINGVTRLVIYCDRLYAKDLVQKQLPYNNYCKLSVEYKTCLKSMLINIINDRYTILKEFGIYYGRKVIDVFDIHYNEGSSKLYITTIKGKPNLNSINQNLINCRCSIENYYNKRFLSTVSKLRNNGILESVEKMSEEELNFVGLSILAVDGELFYFDVANSGDKISFKSQVTMKKNLYSINF